MIALAGSVHMIANYANIHFTKSMFGENSILTLFLKSHFRNTQMVKNQNKLNQSNMQTILSQILQLSPALNTVKPA